MEETTSYVVEITAKAEQYYFELLENLYKGHSVESANKKSKEILDMATSLGKTPYIGSKESILSYLNKEHRYLIYHITKRKTVKIVYFIEEELQKIYITDFFPTEMHQNKIQHRN